MKQHLNIKPKFVIDQVSHLKRSKRFMFLRNDNFRFSTVICKHQSNIKCDFQRPSSTKPKHWIEVSSHVWNQRGLEVLENQLSQLIQRRMWTLNQWLLCHLSTLVTVCTFFLSYWNWTVFLIYWSKFTSATTFIQISLKTSW